MASIGLSALFMVFAAVVGSPVVAKVAALPHAPASQFTEDFGTHEELLTALEKAEHGLSTLTADIIRRKLSPIGGEDQVWRGKLFYLIDTPASPTAPAKRRFAVQFDSLTIGRVLHDRRQQYIFDGRVLIERLPEEKLQTERVIVGPGETFDPMAVGEGRLPIPIGQRAADILARYDVTLLPPAADLDPEADKTLIAHTQAAYQLRLVPKPEFAREESFAQIRLWYDKATLLPILSRTQGHMEEEQETILLLDTKKNAAVPEDALDGAAPAGWRVQVVEWRGGGGDEQRPDRSAPPPESPDPNKPK